MKRLLVVGMVCCLLGGVVASDAGARSKRKRDTSVVETSGVSPQQGLEEILDLWRDGRYEELYARTTPSGRTTKEAFLEKIAAAPRRPAASWEKMQEVSVSMGSADAAAVHAKLGFEGELGRTEFSTRSYRLVREEGVWKMSQADIFALAKITKKKRSRRTAVIR